MIDKGRSMGWQQGEGSAAGEDPARESAVPSGAPRDERLSGFAAGGEWDGCLPGPELAAVLAAVAGPDWRCPGAEPDELIGVLRRAAAQESYAQAAKVGLIQEMIRRDDPPVPGRTFHGDLPDQWSDSLNHELALGLECSVLSAEKTAMVAWELGARLPGIGALLADGTLTYAKARLVTETFALLSDADAARAEALLIPHLAGKTPGQISNLANRIAARVDPGLAERRRTAAVQHASRVQLFREESGAAALCGRDLPPDETLAANANVNARAAEYKASGAFPGIRMDQFRATAYLDLINGRSADVRIALGYLAFGPEHNDAPPNDDPPDDGDPPGNDPLGNDPGGLGPNGGSPDDDPVDEGLGDFDLGDDGPSDFGPGDECPDRDPGGTAPPTGNRPGLGGPGNGSDRMGDGPASGAGAAPNGRPVLTDLVVPLVTLLGLAERPGEAHGLGVLDPGLCRDLAALAAANPHTQLCITVTDPDGATVGHGCAKPGTLADVPPGKLVSGMPPPPVSLPARVNLTIAADRLSAMLPPASGRPFTADERTMDWVLAQAGRASPCGAGGAGGAEAEGGGPADPQWCGTWRLILPGGRTLAVRIEQVATHRCDHRHESFAYQPNAILRHHVQIRDYVCTFPSCNRHARESDFEHCQPYDQGGRTCACNAGARSRKCHRVKQSKGWSVTQPKPGWHTWTTPSGRTYIQSPYQYPV
jgi:hypothetical protein